MKRTDKRREKRKHNMSAYVFAFSCLFRVYGSQNNYPRISFKSASGVVVGAIAKCSTR